MTNERSRFPSLCPSNSSPSTYESSESRSQTPSFCNYRGPRVRVPPLRHPSVCMHALLGCRLPTRLCVYVCVRCSSYVQAAVSLFRSTSICHGKNERKEKRRSKIWENGNFLYSKSASRSCCSLLSASEDADGAEQRYSSMYWFSLHLCISNKINTPRAYTRPAQVQTYVLERSLCCWVRVFWRARKVVSMLRG